MNIRIKIVQLPTVGLKILVYDIKMVLYFAHALYRHVMRGAYKSGDKVC